MTDSGRRSPHSQLSSPGLTGRSSTPRPLRNFLLSLEYWVARSSRATTPGVRRGLRASAQYPRARASCSVW
ncbi:hypothetical protein E4K66_11070 [Bradyrhizobium frederickii]|uniref:Uncharacterized protein n=1 Tax=Bradyrhizobium frederickii TaxID=2560054 RepID=A0A4Y9L954_9BRAD|nr:hypothetical protein E4K66_11070 [Bradyrhizobium frederickii]